MLATSFYSPASTPIDLQFNDVVQIVLQNRAKTNGECDQHPWHLHGYQFWVLGYGDGEYIPSIHEKTLNLVNPLLADTVTNFPSNFSMIRNAAPFVADVKNAYKACGWTVIRFVADNPGFWHFHCHVDWDIALGTVI
jgi:L-ascorbate oxidase